MRGALLERTPVLSLAPDSIASLGDLDATSLSDLWGVFTKCKDSLQNGRRLENLSWRLWFESDRREARMVEASRCDARGEPLVGVYSPGALDDGDWSDPEWTESDSDGGDPDDEHTPGVVQQLQLQQQQQQPPQHSRPRRPSYKRTESSTTSKSTSTTATAVEGASRPIQVTRRSLTGGSLQRMITGLTSLPDITVPSKARSAVDVPAPSQLIPSPELASRGSSAPDVCDSIPASRASPSHSTPSRSTPTKPVSPNLARLSESSTPTLLRSLALTRQLSSSSSRSRSTRGTPRKSVAHVPAPPPTSPIDKPVAAAPVSNVLLAAQRSASHTAMGRNASTTSLEPKSYVKGFDTSAFDSRPKQGSIAPPPTPAPPPPMTLADSPPSAMKSAVRGPPSAVAAGKQPAGKKIFFIESPNSDSEDDGSSPPSRHSNTNSQKRLSTPSALQKSVNLEQVKEAQAQVDSAAQPGRSDAPEKEEEWDDDEESDSESSGWGSDYSSESDDEDKVRAGPSEPTPARLNDMFAKRPPSTGGPGELKPRGPGLLSQLFHPDMFVETERSHSTVDMQRAKTMPHLHTSRSAGVLTDKSRNKSFMKGKPDNVEMESSSEDEDGYEDVEDEEAETNETNAAGRNAVAAALARHQARLAAANLAPPQSPRTTRRAMLATELSESLRRNLLWERQTRNRVLGGAINPRFQPLQPIVQPPLQTSRSTAGAIQHPPPARPSFEGLRAPHPSPATRNSSPIQPMVRRHTTGTGLYLEAQTGRWAPGRSPTESDEETSSDEEPPSREQNVYQSAFEHGVHDHGW